LAGKRWAALVVVAAAAGVASRLDVAVAVVLVATLHFIIWKKETKHFSLFIFFFLHFQLFNYKHKSIMIMKYFSKPKLTNLK